MAEEGKSRFIHYIRQMGWLEAVPKTRAQVYDYLSGRNQTRATEFSPNPCSVSWNKPENLNSRRGLENQI
jgi:hypothetical protein